MKNKFKLNGLVCEACVKLVARRIEKIAGVSGLAINRETNYCEVDSEREIKLSEISQSLVDTDFKAELIS